MKTNRLSVYTAIAATIFCLLSSIHSFAQAPNWTWAKSAGGTKDDFGSSIATDANGNVLVTGYFGSTTLTFGTTTLTNASVDNYDIFIVKYDGSGNVLWAKSAGGTGSDYGSSVATDANGNVFVTGYFSSPTLTFGTTTLTNASTDTTDIFIVKLSGGSNAGFNENNFKSNINVYPNPTHTHLLIDIGSENPMSKIKIENTTGLQVFQLPINQQQFTLDLPGWLGKGVYFLYIYDEDARLVSVRKIVLQ